MVDSDTERAVTSEAFLNISREMLCKLLARDTLFIDEVVLFKAVEKWASKKLKGGGLDESIEDKRAVLGEEVIKLIRFPLMSHKKFVEKVLPTEILSMNEVIELLQCFNAVAPLKGSFTNAIRRGRYKFVVPNTRFTSVMKSNGSWSYRQRLDAVDFKVNKPLSLAGVRLFGNKNCSYDVVLTIYKGNKNLQKTFSTFRTEDEETDGYYGFTIHLDESVPLEPVVVYTIEATISGPDSYYGHLGNTIVSFEDIVIMYMDSKKPSFGTTSQVGQFPTLVFKRRDQT